MNDNERYEIWRGFLDGVVQAAGGEVSGMVGQLLELREAPKAGLVQAYMSQLGLETAAIVEMLRALGYSEYADRVEMREREHAIRRERARRWGVWLTQALAEEGETPAELMRQLGTLHPATVTRWHAGENIPQIEQLVPIARFLNRNPLDVFRAAGYDAFAADVERIVSETYEQVRASFAAESDAEPTAADLLKAIQSVGSQVGDLIAQVGEGMARNAADIEAAANLAHRQQRAIDATLGQVDEVRADVDALTGEVGVTDRALRGHIDDPRAHEEPDSEVE